MESTTQKFHSIFHYSFSFQYCPAATQATQAKEAEAGAGANSRVTEAGESTRETKKQHRAEKQVSVAAERKSNTKVTRSVKSERETEQEQERRRDTARIRCATATAGLEYRHDN